jgi:hypothetical protein
MRPVTGMLPFYSARVADRVQPFWHAPYILEAVAFAGFA